MSLSTFSIFYPTIEITISNQYINFDEGGGELTATVESGSFTLNDLVTKIKTAMDAVGGLTYTISLDRDTRKITISSTANFSILLSTGSQKDSSPFSVIGFTSASDLSGASTYTGSSSAGTEYENQFILQDYIDQNHYQEKVNANVNESGSGLVEVVSFGDRNFFNMSFKFITDLTMDGKIIKNKPNGVSDFVTFMQNITKKGPFEFMPNIDDRSTYYKVILESTPSSNNGTGYKLEEMVSDNLPGIYEINNIKLRVVT